MKTAETSETLEKGDNNLEELRAKLEECKEKAKDRDEWKKKNGELQIAFSEEEIKHLKELYNARVSKWSLDLLAMMSPDTMANANAQELCRPSEVTVLQQRMSPPSTAKKTITDLSDIYVAPQFQARATMQEIPRARDRSLGRINPSQRVKQGETTDLTEPAGVVLRGAKARSRVIDIRKDLNNRKNVVQVAAGQPRACLNGMTWNPATIHQPVPTASQHLIIADSLVRDLKDSLVVGQTAVISFGGASVAQVIKMMELQNDDSVDTQTLRIETNVVSKNPVTSAGKWQSLPDLSPQRTKGEI